MKNTRHCIFLILAILGFGGLLAQNSVIPAGSGTQSDPYQIASLENLCWMASDAGDHYAIYAQVADIDASISASWNNGRGWVFPNLVFFGKYYGQNHSISSLCINDTTMAYSGLFNVLYNAVIWDLNLISANITGGLRVGALAGGCAGSTIYNCDVYGVVNAPLKEAKSGGLLGECSGTTVYNCRSYESIIAYSASTGEDRTGLSKNQRGPLTYAQCTGGLVGKALGGYLTNCHSLSPVTGKYNCGGIVGWASGYLSGNTFDSTVSGCGFVGGIAGFQDDGEISSCDPQGSVTGYFSVGGVAGLCGGLISNCTSTGSVSGTCEVGGIAGFAFAGTIRNCVNESPILPGIEHIGGIVGWTSEKSELESCFSAGPVEGDTAVGGITGLCEDTTVNSCQAVCPVYGVDVVGGLFGCCSRSTVTNCIARGSVIATGNLAGGTTGESSVAKYSYCTNLCAIEAGNIVGGMIGSSEGDSLMFCSSQSSTIARRVAGGLVGKARYYTSILDCYSNNYVSAADTLGGLVGVASDRVYIQRCFTYSTLNAQHGYVGGFIAFAHDCRVENSFSRAVFGPLGHYWCGGFIGMFDSSEIVNCYSVIRTTSGFNSCGIEGFGVNNGGLYPSGCFWNSGGIDDLWDDLPETSLVAMRNINTYITAGWDFTGEMYNGHRDYWSIEYSVNDGLPYLAGLFEYTPAPDEQADTPVPAPAMSNYPNPFNPSTTIKFNLPQAGNVELTVYNVRGQKVRTLLNSTQSAGNHSVVFDGHSDNGNSLASGMYLYRLTAGGKSITNKMLMLK